MKRIKHAALVALVSWLSAPLAFADPVPPPALHAVTHNGEMSGTGTIASPLGLTPCGSPGQGWIWNGSAFACASAGGITNGAGNNVIMKSNGTNAVASAASDNGTTFSIGDALSVTGAATFSAGWTSTAGANLLGEEEYNTTSATDTSATYANVNWPRTARAVLWSISGAVTIRGMGFTSGSPVNGQHFEICVFGGGTLTLTNEDSLETTATLRYNIPNAQNMIVNSGRCSDFTYETSSNRWHPRSGVGSGFGGTSGDFTMYGGINNIQTAPLHDDGSFISSSTSRQWTMSSSMLGTATQHGLLTAYSAGTNLTVGDGGIQSFQQSSYDTSAADRQSLAIYAGNTATKGVAGHLLANYAVMATASGGDSNFSFYGVAGQIYNANAAHWGSTETVDGLATFNAGLTVGGGQPVTLSTNVGSFAMPNGGNGSSLIMGATSTVAGAPGEIQIVNNTGTRNLEIDVIGNTTATSNVIPRYGLYRGAAGGSLKGALQLDDGTFPGAAADDMVLYSANKVAISSGGTTPELVFTSNNHINIPSQAGKPTLTSCGTSPTNTGSDIDGTFTTGTGGTTCTATFAKTYTNQPSCVLTTYGSATPPTCSVSATAITCSTTVAATTYAYHCASQNGT
ncbi:MAG TPA: hypothetical protein VLT45_23025 [Kofleriaceae bacterium]|nr:hypothetical protein [Kofleriaceae bacterium]